MGKYGLWSNFGAKKSPTLKETMHSKELPGKKVPPENHNTNSYSPNRKETYRKYEGKNSKLLCHLTDFWQR